MVILVTSCNLKATLISSECLLNEISPVLSRLGEIVMSVCGNISWFDLRNLYARTKVTGTEIFSLTTHTLVQTMGTKSLRFTRVSHGPRRCLLSYSVFDPVSENLYWTRFTDGSDLPLQPQTTHVCDILATLMAISASRSSVYSFINAAHCVRTVFMNESLDLRDGRKLKTWQPPCGQMWYCYTAWLRLSVSWF